MESIRLLSSELEIMLNLNDEVKNERIRSKGETYYANEKYARIYTDIKVYFIYNGLINYEEMELKLRTIDNEIKIDGYYSDNYESGEIDIKGFI